MVKSMTGFGKATVEFRNKKIVVEIKSLNSKQLDLNLRMPNIYREKEMEIRNMVKERMERGKVEMNIFFDNTDGVKTVSVNQSAVMQYFNQMLEVSGQLDILIDKAILLQTVMRFPDTLRMKEEELADEEWLALQECIGQALQATDAFRIQEGKALIDDVVYRIGLIRQFAEQLTEFETKRVEIIRQKMAEKLNECTDVKDIDKNRFEQEIIYYLEKLDITEEKIRLANHCKYFLETVDKEESSGRKIGFIAQEMGREINTIGSKACDYNIQRLVVKMKDELEKIKEQSLNIL